MKNNINHQLDGCYAVYNNNDGIQTYVGEREREREVKRGYAIKNWN